MVGRDLQILANLPVTAMIGHAESLAFAPGKPEAERAIARTPRRQLHMVLIGALRWDPSREGRPSPFS